MSATSQSGPSKHPRPAGAWRTGGGVPLIGISPDVIDRNGRVTTMCAMAYASAIVEAGGIPLVLAPIPELIPEYLRRLSGIVLTGGDDPRMEPFGVATDPRVTPVHAQRQGFEVDLLKAIDEFRPQMPTLGICLGMQMLALHHGGRLDQQMADTRPDAARHWASDHPIIPSPEANEIGPTATAIPAGVVHSHHRQAVSDPGRMRVVATSDDGVIEAIVHPERPFVLGVQWHPERTAQASLGVDLFKRLLAAARLSPG